MLMGRNPPLQHLSGSDQSLHQKQERKVHGGTTVVLSISTENMVSFARNSNNVQCYKCWRILRDRLYRLAVLCTYAEQIQHA